MGDYVRREYHDEDYSSNWRRTYSNAALFGIELEVEDAVTYRNVLAALPDPGRGNVRPDVETDGSLNHYKGVEIIFPPYSPSTVRNPNSFFAKCLLALNASSAESTDRCGMHINVNVGGWNEQHILHFSLMFEAIKPGALSNIGGRSLNDYCGQLLRNSHEDWNWEHDRVDQYLDATEDNHHCVCSYRGNRVELRFPKATFNHSRVVLLTRLSDTVRAFIKTTKGKNLLEDLVDYADEDNVEEKLNNIHDNFIQFLRGLGRRFSADEVLENLEYAKD